MDTALAARPPTQPSLPLLHVLHVQKVLTARLGGTAASEPLLLAPEDTVATGFRATADAVARPAPRALQAHPPTLERPRTLGATPPRSKPLADSLRSEVSWKHELAPLRSARTRPRSASLHGDRAHRQRPALLVPRDTGRAGGVLQASKSRRPSGVLRTCSALPIFSFVASAGRHRFSLRYTRATNSLRSDKSTPRLASQARTSVYLRFAQARYRRLLRKRLSAEHWTEQRSSADFWVQTLR